MTTSPTTQTSGDPQVLLLSSMATRNLLEQACELINEHGPSCQLKSMGGVAAAEEVRQHSRADVVVLAQRPIESLADEGLLDPESTRALFASQTVLARRHDDLGTGSTPVELDIESSQDLVEVLTHATATGYSTGPSGRGFLALLEELGLRQQLEGRLVQAPPGTPVAQLLTEGTVDLGIQQRSEFLGHDGLELLRLPAGREIITTFAGGITRDATDPQAAQRVLELLCSPRYQGLAAGFALDPAAHRSAQPTLDSQETP